MKHLKLFGVIYLINWSIVTAYFLIFGTGGLGWTLYGSMAVLQWIFFPLWFAVLTNALLNKIDISGGSKRVLTVRIVFLIAILFLTEATLSMIRTIAFDYLTWDNFRKDFSNVWGLFIPGTVLTGVLLPLLDYHYSKQTKDASQQGA